MRFLVEYSGGGGLDLPKNINSNKAKSAYFEKLAIYFAISHFHVLLTIFFACQQEISLVNLPPEAGNYSKTHLNASVKLKNEPSINPVVEISSIRD